MLGALKVKTTFPFVSRALTGLLQGGFISERYYNILKQKLFHESAEDQTHSNQCN